MIKFNISSTPIDLSRTKIWSEILGGPQSPKGTSCTFIFKRGEQFALEPNHNIPMFDLGRAKFYRELFLLHEPCRRGQFDLNYDLDLISYRLVTTYRHCLR